MALFDNADILNFLGIDSKNPTRRQVESSYGLGKALTETPLPSGSDFRSPWQGVNYLTNQILGRAQMSAANAADRRMFLNAIGGITGDQHNLSGGESSFSGGFSQTPSSSGTGLPASVRTNNPGAMWPGKSASAFGSTSYETLKDGNKIAKFDNPVDGGAALFDLLSKNYAGMPLDQAIKKWSGNNSAEEYTKLVTDTTGLSSDTVLTPDLLKNPEVAIPLAKAMAKQESGRENTLSDSDWAQAFTKYAGGAGIQVAQAQSPTMTSGGDQPGVIGGNRQPNFLSGDQSANVPLFGNKAPTPLVPLAGTNDTIKGSIFDDGLPSQEGAPTAPTAPQAPTGGAPQVPISAAPQAPAGISPQTLAIATPQELAGVIPGGPSAPSEAPAAKGKYATSFPKPPKPMTKNELLAYHELSPEDKQMYDNLRAAKYTPKTYDTELGTYWQMQDGSSGFISKPKEGAMKIGDMTVPYRTRIHPDSGEPTTEFQIPGKEGSKNGGWGPITELRSAEAEYKAKSAGMLETAKAASKIRQAPVNEAVEKGNKAVETIPIYQAARALENIPETADVHTGRYADEINELKKIVNDIFPGTFDKTPISLSEIFNKLGTHMGVSLAKSLTNRPTQFDFKTLLNVSISTQLSPTGRRALLSFYETMNDQDVEVGKLANKYAGDPEKFQEERQKYYKEHPVNLKLDTANGEYVFNDNGTVDAPKSAQQGAQISPSGVEPDYKFIDGKLVKQRVKQ